MLYSPTESRSNPIYFAMQNVSLYFSSAHDWKFESRVQLVDFVFGSLLFPHVAPMQLSRRLNASFRQWPEEYDSCHTFLHVARVRKHTDMREWTCENACNSRMSVCFLTRSTCKNVRQNLIPRATAYRLRAVGPHFQTFSTIQGKKRAKHLLSLLLRGSTIARITLMRQARTPASGRLGVLPRARLQVLQNSRSRMFMLRVTSKSLSVRDRRWWNPRERKIIDSESAAI